MKSTCFEPGVDRENVTETVLEPYESTTEKILKNMPLTKDTSIAIPAAVLASLLCLWLWTLQQKANEHDITAATGKQKLDSIERTMSENKAEIKADIKEIKDGIKTQYNTILLELRK